MPVSARRAVVRGRIGIAASLTAPVWVSSSRRAAGGS